MDARILVVGHGELPTAMVGAARLIGGALPGVDALGLAAHMTPTEFGQAVGDALAALDGPVIILSDLRGGTPDNVARLHARGRGDTWVLANASLALLLELALGAGELDDESLTTLCDGCQPAVAHTPETRTPAASAVSSGALASGGSSFKGEDS